MEHKTTVRALFLDVGGVLLTNGWDHNSRALAAETFNLDPKELESRHRLNFDTHELGKLSLEVYLDRVIFYEKRDFSRSQFLQFMLDQSKAFPEMIDLLSALKKRYDLKVVAVNNEGRELNEYRIKKFNLTSFVDFFISSSFVHLRKPDVDIFRLALDAAQTSDNQVIYIDDRLMLVQVAKTLGVQGIHHEGFESTKEKLASYGLTLN